ncbi:hypothetical protein AB0L40_21455 [Patulibacter sp. NPDC049589]|uniref:hypothetical protein n=1 Tax=Patulibacter sp. NPDC049589 TaxID=3154731 RepID=UPI00344651B7
MPRYAIGQHVELLPTIPSPEGGTIPGGSTAIVREIDTTGERPLYRVVFLEEEHPVGELVWLGENDVIEA